MEKENLSNVELFDDDEIIELFDDSNKAIKFYEIASVELDGKFYELLKPVTAVEGIDEDEAVILEYVLDENGEEKQFKPMFNEDLMERVFDEYLKAVSDDDCDCGCGCGEDCDCDGEDCDCEGEDCDCGCGEGKQCNCGK